MNERDWVSLTKHSFSLRHVSGDARDWSPPRELIELDVPAVEYQRRLGALRHRMETKGLRQLAVIAAGAEISNLRYLTGFASTRGASVLLLLPSGATVLVSASLAHDEPMHSCIHTMALDQLRIAGSDAEVLQMCRDILEKEGSLSLAIGLCDLQRMPYRLAMLLTDTWSGVAIANASTIVDELRAIKSPAEIEAIREGARITSRAIDAAFNSIEPEMTEAAIAAVAHAACVSEGAERMVFGTSGASGRRGALKNVVPSPSRKLADGDLYILDLGCKYKGYATDISRNAVVGKPPPFVLKMLDVCLEAEEAAISSIRAGVTTVTVAETMKEVFSSHGLADYSWPYAHGIGLDLLEEPIFKSSEPRTLKAGMCFCVEPIVGHPDHGCVCIEDMVLVLDDGCEELTTATKRRW